MACGFEPLRACPCRIGPFRCQTLKTDWELERAAALFGPIVGRIWLSSGHCSRDFKRRSYHQAYKARHSQTRRYVNAALRLMLCSIVLYHSTSSTLDMAQTWIGPCL